MFVAIPTSSSKTQFYINQAYADYVNSVPGLSAMIITPNSNYEELMALCGGLLLPGGIDIDPIHYGDDNFASFSVDPEKDNFERSLMYIARSAGLPIFGICRGFQLLAYEYLATADIDYADMHFLQNINTHQQTEDVSAARSNFSHFISAFKSHLYWDGSDMATEFTAMSRMPVNSMHHQCLVGVRGKYEFGGLIALGGTVRGVKDKSMAVCEAFRIVDWESPVLAVQWHPEELKDTELLESFFKSSGKKFPTMQLEPKRKYKSTKTAGA